MGLLSSLISSVAQTAHGITSGVDDAMERTGAPLAVRAVTQSAASLTESLNGAAGGLGGDLGSAGKITEIGNGIDLAALGRGILGMGRAEPAAPAPTAPVQEAKVEPAFVAKTQFDHNPADEFQHGLAGGGAGNRSVGGVGGRG